MLSDSLHGLRDVEDVHGSFLLGGEGELLARDLPAVFHAELFAEVGPRLARLRQTFDPSGVEATTATLRFADHKLYLRSLGPQLLCVLTGAKVNVPALRMAMNLVARRVESHGVLPSEIEEVTTTLAVNGLTGPPTARSHDTTRDTVRSRRILPESGPMTGPDSRRPEAAAPGSGSRRDVLYRGRRT